MPSFGTAQLMSAVTASALRSADAMHLPRPKVSIAAETLTISVSKIKKINKKTVPEKARRHSTFLSFLFLSIFTFFLSHKERARFQVLEWVQLSPELLGREWKNTRFY